MDAVDVLTEDQLAIASADDLRQSLRRCVAREADLKAKYERLRVDTEQQHFELEQLLRLEHEKLESESKAASELRSFVNDLEQKYLEISEKYRDLQNKYFEKDKYWNLQEQSLLHKNGSLESEKADLMELLNKKRNEVEQLTAEGKLNLDRLNEETRLRLVAQTAADEAKSEMMILQHRTSRLNQELTSLHQQNGIFNSQLQERFNEIMTVRKEKSERLIELQGLLDDSEAQVKQLEQSLGSSKAVQVDQTAQIESYVEKLRDARDAQTQLEERYRSELIAQDKLLGLYKVTAVEGETKIQEMSKAVEELQQLLTQATQAYSDLKSEHEEYVRISEEQQSERDDKIRSLETELVRADELMEVMKKKVPSYISEEDARILSPTAAAASQLLKSGMTLTQIYGEYVETLNQLQHEREENGRLTDYLDKILKEFEEKAPVIKKQKADYEEAVNAIERLTQQLTTALTECENSRLNADDSHRRCGELRRQNDRYKVQLKDLSLQVRMLLKELEEARGTVVRMSADGDDDDDDSEVTSSSHLISEKLVSFRSIEELQEQNQKLLVVVRELSEASEASEKSRAMDCEDSQRMTELRQQLEAAVNEIEEMKAGRERQAVLVESLIQQREMFRAMAETHQMTSSPQLSYRSPVSSTPTIPPSPVVPAATATAVTVFGEADQKVLQETRSALKELQEEFSSYRQEKGKNEKMLDEQLEKVTREASELRLQSAKLGSQLSYSNERYKILQSNIESHKKEIEVLRDKNQKLSESVIKHQQTLLLLREEAKTSQEKLCAVEIRNQNLLKEKGMLKSVEARLSAELEALRRDFQSRDLLMTNLQSIQNNLERAEFETKTRLGQRIDALERENTVLRKKADGTDEQQKAFIITLERQLSEARTDADVEKTRAKRLSEQLETADSHVIHLRQELFTSESKLASTETKLNAVNQMVQDLQNQIDPTQKLNEEINTQRLQLEDSQREITNLQEKLDQSRKHTEQFKSIADGLEHSLRQQNESSKQFRESLESQLHEALEAKEMLDAQLKELETEKCHLTEENKVLNAENQQLSKEKAQMTTDSSQSGALSLGRIAILEKELKDVIDERDIALSNEVSARFDCEVQAKEARDAYDSYQRELLLHAADVETLSQLKQQLESFDAKLVAAESEVKQVNSQKLAAQESWKEQETVLQNEVASLSDRLTSLHAQNCTLHEQLEKMADQMKQIQSEKDQEEVHTRQLVESVEKEANPKASEQLFEVIRYLRREKDVVEAERDVINAEVNRLRHEVTYLRKQLESTEQALAQEVEKTAIKVETAAQHAELMRKVETLNLLQDSNQLLRGEKDRLFQQVKQLETKSATLEGELEPLKDFTNVLVAQQDASRHEVELLREEADRWKNRANQVIEKWSKFDPEELKRALDDRDQMKRHMDVVVEECQSLKKEVLQLNENIRTAENEVAVGKEQSKTLSKELEDAKTSIAAREADEEEKTKTIAQLRKIGRKYRMQAEEVQKELEELKATRLQEATAEMNDRMKNAEQEISQLQLKLKQSELDSGELSRKLANSEQEKDDAVKQVKAVEERERELQGQLTRLKEELSKASEENSSIADSHMKSVEERGKVMDEYNHLIEDNMRLKEERKKLEEGRSGLQEDNRKLADQVKEMEKKQFMTRNLVMNAKQRLEERKAECDRVNAENLEMKRRMDEDRGEISRLTDEVKSLQQKIDQQTSAEEMELRISTLKSQFEGKVSRLERELGEQATARTADAEALERLRRENHELQQRVTVLHSQCESFQRQYGQSPTKPTISAPPVERPGSGSSDVQRCTYIKPMTTAVPAKPQRHSAPVQPVRSTAGIAAETRAMVASIRPMAVASTQPAATPMATVMPTTMSVQENDSLLTPNLLSQSPVTTAAVMSQGRPTQQVQPVSSHVEESTVSSSEEQASLDGLQPHGTWWHEQPTPSTSSEHSLMTSVAGTSTGLTSKRPREETRQQDESTENENETSAKRSKLQAGEAADTTETNAVTEVEREAASVAHAVDNQQPPAAEMRRELEPVSTSLAMEELSRNSEALQQDHLRKHMSSADQAEDLVDLPADDLPDYQEVEASAEYDIHPSTSRQPGSDVDDQSNQGSLNPSEPRDDAEDAAVDLQANEDVICVEEEEEEEGTESGVYRGQPGTGEYQGDNSEDEEEYNRNYSEEVEEIEEEEEEFEGEGKEENMAEDAYDAADAEIHVEGEDNTNDVIVLDDDVATGSSESGCHRDRSSEDVVMQDDNMVPVSTVSTSQPHQVMQRHPGLSAGRVVNVAADGGAMRLIPQATGRSSFGVGPMDRLAMGSRAQLMPFLFSQSDAGSAFEIGDDGIVPSTPTLQISVRTDGFAEAVSSPQVTEEFIMFGSSSESMPHLELAHQRGIGVDDTRMDLSQFDEHSSRGLLLTPPCSQTSPAFPMSHLSPESFQEQMIETQQMSSRGERSSTDAVKALDPVPSCSSHASVGLLPGSHSEALLSHEDYSHGDARPTVAETNTEGRTSAVDDRPSTSESGSSLDKPETQAQTKPKIKKIVWQEPGRDDASAAGGPTISSQPVVSSQQQQQAALQGPSTSQPRRGYVRANYRGRAGAAQHQVRPLLTMPTVPPASQSPQVARRARGGTRGAHVWSTRQQQHYQ